MTPSAPVCLQQPQVRCPSPLITTTNASNLQGLRFTVWPAKGRMFPKLRLKFKPSLVSLAGGMTSLPVTDPSARATPLQPAAWKQMLADSQVRVTRFSLLIRTPLRVSRYLLVQ